MSRLAGRGGALGTLFRFEIKMLLRDRRTLVVSVLLPVVVLPGILLVSHKVDQAHKRRIAAASFTYTVTGPMADWARERVREALSGPPSPDSSDATPARFGERDVARADSSLGSGEVDLVVVGMDAASYAAALEVEGDTVEAADVRADRTQRPVIRLEYRSNSDVSRAARRSMQERLSELRASRRREAFRSRGLAFGLEELGAIEAQNVASAEKEGGTALGLILTPLLVLLMLSGGSVVAADAISGEKERGTLETLLTTAARRNEIVAAKQLAIVAVGIVIALINVANLLIYLGLGLFDLPADFRVAVSPLSVLVVLLLFLPLSALVSSVLLTVSGYSKTYREYQIYFFPIFLVFMLPSLAAVLPGVELRSAIALVPLANVSVAVKEVLAGKYDWLFLAITFAVTSGAALYGARLTSRSLSTERLITAAELERADLSGGPELFERRVLRWYAGLWAAVFVVALWVGDDLGVRGQVLINLLGLFLGASLLMIRRYRLDARQALALRGVDPRVWLAVLIGAPSGFVTGIGLARLSQLALPVPERMIESFSQFLLPEGVPLWQIVLLLCLLPGICEEIAFRGVLFYGLRKRFHPVVLCVVVGAVFGLFHMSLFRLVPTAYLGIALAAVVALTGSIFPAMLWHALNNAAGLIPARLGLWPQDGLPAWAALPGLLGLGLAFWILWRTRRPYPGLGRSEHGG